MSVRWITCLPAGVDKVEKVEKVDMVDYAGDGVWEYGCMGVLEYLSMGVKEYGCIMAYAVLD